MAYRKDAEKFIKVQRKAERRTSDDADWFDDINIAGARMVLIEIDVHSNSSQSASTANYFDINLSHSDDGVTYTAVPIAEITAAATITGNGRLIRDQAGYSAGQTKHWQFTYKGDRQYLRIGFNAVGTINNKLIDARVITADQHILAL